MKHYQFFAAAAAALALGACSAGEGEFTVKLGASDGGAAKLATAASGDTVDPAQFEEINVVIKEISVRKSGGADEVEGDKEADKSGFINVFTGEKAVNLVALFSGETVDIETADLEAGDYDQVRIVVAEDNTVKLTGDTTAYDLKIPSGTSSGIKIKKSFTLEEGGAADMTLEFDAAASISEGGSQDYRLSPVIKVKDVTEEK